MSANLALFALIRSDEPTAVVTQLTEFLRLPETSQRILATAPADGRPGVVAVANAQRVMATFGASQVPPILKVHLNAGFSVYVGFADDPGSGRDVFDFIFRVNSDHLSDWTGASITCEKGVKSGALREGESLPLEEIPLMAALLTRSPQRA